MSSATLPTRSVAIRWTPPGEAVAEGDEGHERTELSADDATRWRDCGQHAVRDLSRDRRTHGRHGRGPHGNGLHGHGRSRGLRDPGGARYAVPRRPDRSGPARCTADLVGSLLWQESLDRPRRRDDDGAVGDRYRALGPRRTGRGSAALEFWWRARRGCADLQHARGLAQFLGGAAPGRGAAAARPRLHRAQDEGGSCRISRRTCGACARCARRSAPT